MILGVLNTGSIGRFIEKADQAETDWPTTWTSHTTGYIICPHGKGAEE